MTLLHWTNRLRRWVGRAPLARKCCRDRSNWRALTRLDTELGSVVTHQCSVCAAKHHEMTAHPGTFGIEGA